MANRPNQPSDVFKYINTHHHDPTVCWEWVGGLVGRDGDKRGYFPVQGKRRLAQHIVYELFGSPNGPIDAGLVHRHTCDNTLCCNPYHTIPGTQSDNEHDKYERDRAGYPTDVVKEIDRWARLGANSVTIAAHINATYGLNVSASGVGKVMRGDRRKRQTSQLDNNGDRDE